MFKLIRRFILICILLIVIITSLFVGVGYFSYKDVCKEESIEEKVNTLRSNENYISIEQVSKPFQNAIVAIEDHRFYNHNGIDYISLVRITLANLMTQNVLGGGSTITQQLAKNFYFMENYSLTRKVSEAFVANQLENKYSKDEILEMYINIIYYGDNHYGIKEASLGYFDVEPIHLSIAQASMLAGLPQSPSRYALSTGNKDAYKRQQEVLQAMIKYEYINNKEFKAALEEKLY